MPVQNRVVVVQSAAYDRTRNNVGRLRDEDVTKCPCAEIPLVNHSRNIIDERQLTVECDTENAVRLSTKGTLEPATATPDDR